MVIKSNDSFTSYNSERLQYTQPIKYLLALFVNLFKICGRDLLHQLYIYIYIYIYRLIGQGGRVFANYPGDFKKWYLIPPCLALSDIRYVSRVKWCNPGKRVAPSPTPRCSSYWKGSLRIALDYSRHFTYFYIYIYIYIVQFDGDSNSIKSSWWIYFGGEYYCSNLRLVRWLFNCFSLVAE